MCGIAGLYNYPGSWPDPDHVVRSMIDSLTHRGPDAEGLWVDERRRCVLGHRRLSIIDTSDAGRQPMITGDGQWVIAFNGEIYNFLEIREQLEAKGVRFRGRTDTEVLLESIAFWGIEALPKLDGMFALSAFNRRSGELIVARDAFGEKPLYHLELPGGGLAFASELQALEKLPNFEGEVSLDAMAEVLMFQYIGAPRTIYRSVKKLPPGHWMRLVPDQPPAIGRFFEFRPGAGGFDSRPLATLVDELEDILLRSIRRRLISDVPLGAFLSGGVDSSTVCALIRNKLGLPLKTFSIGFRHAPESEHEAARLLAKHIGADHHDRVLSPDTSAFLSGIGRVLDEPNGDSSCMPTYLLAEFARREVTVAVSGDGGDELFAGYGRYFSTLEEERVAVRGSGWHPGHAYYSDRILVSTEKYVEELFGEVPAGLARYLRGLRDELADASLPLFCRLRRTDVENYMPGAVLPKVDRMSMQHSLEVRTPYLNMELARFAERLPLDVLYRDGQGKLLLRELASRYLPRDIVNAPKKGFGLPMSRWARDPLLAVASSLLEGEESRLRQALGIEAVGRFMARQRSRDGFSTYQVWALTMLESWLRHHPAKLKAVTEMLRGARALAAARSRSQSKALFAWQVGEKEFSVIEDIDRSNEPGLAAAEPARPDKPLKLPYWGAVIPPQGLPALTALRGAKLIVLDPAVSQKMTRSELEKFVALGVAEIEYPHPHMPDDTILQVRFQRKTPLQRFVSWIRLRRHVVARLGLRRRWELIREVRQGKRQHRRFFSFGPIRCHECPPNEELFHRFMLFEGLKQIPPIPAPHSEIAEGGTGRYSVWNNECFFSPIRFRRLLTHSYRLVERTPQTEPYFQYVCTIVRSSQQQQLEMAGVLDRLIRTDLLSVKEPLPADRPVVVFTHGLPPGGAERQWCYLAAGLKAENQNVVFVSMNELSGSDGHYLPLLLRDEIPVIELGGCPVLDMLRGNTVPQEITRMLLRARSPLPPGVLLRLTALLHTLKPKAVIAQLDCPNLLAAVAGLLSGVPRIVLSFRNYNPSNFSYLRNDWFQRYYQVATRSSSVILAGNSHDANADYARWIGVAAHHVRWIPNCIDTRDVEHPTPDRLTALRRELAVPPATPLVLGVFRCSEEKRPLLFLEVCAKIQEQVPNVRVALIGSGPLEGAMRQFIEQSNLQGVATMLGRRADIADLMSIASLLLLTSEKEGMPNVVMEAQALGVPVVAARTGGIPDLIEHGQSGFIVDGDDPMDFARACLSILRNEDLAEKMGRSGAARVQGLFSRTAMAKGYLRLIAEPDSKPTHA
jgi:asparagine synthase (glutamine-hydrolysing)